MATKSRKRSKRKSQKSQKVSNKKPLVAYLLESGSIQSIRRNKLIIDKLREYHWTQHHELEYQRNKIKDQITEVFLQQSSSNFNFNGWQRLVRFKYSYHPLSARGSIENVGGRFNIGNIDPQYFHPFPGLYIASDKDTALQETLGPTPEDPKIKLNQMEIALTNPKSISIISVSGFLEKMFDLRDSSRLNEFVDLISIFELSTHLKKLAQTHNLKRPRVVKTVDQLYTSLMESNWREFPMQYDIPANPQIFGQLIHKAGIQGICYRSIWTGKDCLVIYPRNFDATASYIKIDDELPDNSIPSKIDSTNWKTAE
ncbi:MAG: RES family NAD+ phosphorylase [Pseudomonadota bacterium]